MSDETTVVAQGDVTDPQQDPIVNADPSPEADPKPDGAVDPQANANEGDQKPETETEEQKNKRKGGWQRQKERAERERDYWRGVALGTIKPPTETPDKPAVEAKPKPKVDDFESMDAYLEARDAWVIEQAEAKAIERLEAKKQAEERKSHEQTQAERWNEREAELAGKNEDYADATQDAIDALGANWNSSQATVQAIRDALQASEDGPGLLYLLGKNADELSRIVKLPPMAAVIALGELKAKVAKEPTPAKVSVPTPPPPPQTQAPVPPTPVKKPATVAHVDLSDPKLPFKDYVKERNRQQNRK